MQPHRGRAGAAVEGKSQRTLRGILAIKRVGDEKHFRFDLAVGALQRKPSSRRGVGERLAVHGDRVMRDDRRDFADVEMFFFVCGLFGLGGLGLLASDDLSVLAAGPVPSWSCLDFCARRLA